MAEHKAQEPVQRDFTLERDQRVIPVARELLKRMAARADLMMGSSASVISEEKLANYYRKIYTEDVVPVLMAHSNLKLKELTYLFSLMLQPTQLLNDVVTASFEMNRDLSDARKYGLKDIGDLDVAMLDASLREANAKEIVQTVEKSKAEVIPKNSVDKKKKSPKKSV